MTVMPEQASVEYEALCPHGAIAAWRSELVRVREERMTAGYQSALLDVSRPVCDCDCEETP